MRRFLFVPLVALVALAFASGASAAGWSGWDSRGGYVTSAAGISSWAPGRLDLFARGGDYQLYHKWYDDGPGWSAWEPLGGSLTTGPAAVSWADGRIDVFARGSDNSLIHKWFQWSTGWSAWESLGGYLTSAPAVTSWAPGRLDVFVRGSDNAVWHKWFDGRWSDWESLGGATLFAPAAASWGEGRIDLFVRGTDNALWHKSFEDGWSEWDSLGGNLTSAPAASSWGTGRIDVFARGADKRGYERKWYHTSSGWSGWQPLGGVFTSDPKAVSWGPGRIDLFGRGTDYAIWHKSYEAAPVGSPDTPGLFRSGEWRLNSGFDGTAERSFSFGASGDLPVAGDWDDDRDASPGVFRNGAWYLNDGFDGTTERSLSYGISGDLPVVGDWNGDGIDTPGVFRSGTWYLNDGFDGTTERTFSYGISGDRPVVGDWNGDGIDTVGVFRNGEWHLNNGFDGTTERFFVYGTTGDRPAAGDWNGDGIDTAGVFRNGEWHLNDGFDGTTERFFVYGASGDVPVAGDWDGDGVDGDGLDTLGVVRNEGGAWGWWLSNDLHATVSHYFQFESCCSTPVVGDWDGDGIESPGVNIGGNRWLLSDGYDGIVDYDFYYGVAGDVPLVGDWDGDGVDTIAIRREHCFYWKNTLEGGPADFYTCFGNPSDKPVVGDWDGNGTDTPGVVRDGVWWLNNDFSGSVYKTFAFGSPGDRPLVGDWNGDTIDTPGVHRGNAFHLSNNFEGTTHHSVVYGNPGDIGIAGDWDAEASMDPDPRAQPFQRFNLEVATPLPETDDRFEYATANWNGDGVPDLFAIKKSGTGTGRTEVHVLSGARKYGQWLAQTGTALGETGANWTFDVADWNRDGTQDLVAIKKSATGTASTEVHVLSGASTFQQWILQTGTPLPETGTNFDFEAADWNRDGSPDLVAVKKNSTGTGTTEVHVLAGPSLQTWLVQTGTPLPQTDDSTDFETGDWNGDGVPDLFAVKQNDTGTASTEPHVLSGAANFGQWLLQTGTALHETDGTFAFDVADWNRDGALDLLAVKKSVTGTQTTEVYALSGARSEPVGDVIDWRDFQRELHYASWNSLAAVPAARPAPSTPGGKLMHEYEKADAAWTGRKKVKTGYREPLLPADTARRLPKGFNTRQLVDWVGRKPTAEDPTDYDSWAPKAINEMDAAGATYHRLTVHWADVQPCSSSDWNIGAYRRVVELAAAKGMKLIVNPTGSPIWARENAGACITDPKTGALRPPDGFKKWLRPDNLDAWSEFVEKLANEPWTPTTNDTTDTWGTRAHAWEIWNEQGSREFWQRTVSPSGWRELYCRARQKLKVVKSDAKVGVGGFAVARNPADWTGAQFMERAYTAPILAGGCTFPGGVKLLLDAQSFVAFHPYAYGEYCFRKKRLPIEKTNAMGQLRALRGVIVRHRQPNIKIWNTEWGFPSHSFNWNGKLCRWGPQAVGVGTRATMLQKQARLIAMEHTYLRRLRYLELSIYFNIRDSAPANGDPRADLFSQVGLIKYDANWTRKPSFARFKQLR